ncbi:MAG: PAAR domain-containing protein [Planctomycetota bacterium]
MPSGFAARVADPVAHPTPPVLTGGMGSTNVLIGFMPAWRGVPLAAAGGVVAMAAATTVRMNAAMARTAAGDPSGAVDLTAASVQFAQNMAGLGCDMHTCGLTTPNPHVSGVVITGSPTVMINNMPACRMGDQIVEAGPPNVITMGCPTVIIGDVGMGGSTAPCGL